MSCGLKCVVKVLQNPEGINEGQIVYGGEGGLQYKSMGGCPKPRETMTKDKETMKGSVLSRTCLVRYMRKG